MLFAQLAVENTTYRFDKPFTYTVPEALAGAVRPGVRVTVPFGALSQSRTRVGMVLSVSEAPAADGRLKAVRSVLDRAPLLSDEMLQLVPWMKSRYYCTLFEAVKLMIPAGIGYKIVNRYRISAAFKDYDRTAYGDLAWQIIMLLSDAKGGMTGAQLSEKLGIDEKSPALRELLEKGIVICENAASRNLNDATARMVCAVPDFSGKLSPKQQSAYDTLCAAGTVTVRELCYYTGVSTAVVKALCEKGAAESFEVERFRRPKVSGKDVALPEALSPEQARVAESIVRECDMPTAAVALLYGITGSGKTAVFMHVIRHVLEGGRGVIVTVPEISLTPQTLAVFTAAFGDTVAVFHSGLSMGERMDEWKRCAQRKGADRRRHALGGLRAGAGARTHCHGRGAGEHLQVGEQPALPRPGNREVPRALQQRVLSALLRDAVGRIVFHGEKRQVPLPRAFEPLRRRAGARRAACRHERGGPLPRQADDQHGAGAGDFRKPRAGAAVDRPAEPPRLPHLRGLQKTARRSSPARTARSP